MPTFHYLAVDHAGASRSGQLQAADRGSALELLHKEGMVPVSLTESPPARLTWDLVSWVRQLRVRRSSSVDLRTLASLTHAIAALIKAGLTIDRALTIAHGLEKRTSARVFLGDLTRSVRSGRTLAEALEATGVALPSYYASMVRAGEAGGLLGETLARVSALLARQTDVRRRVQAALTYPALLAAVVVVTILVLVFFVLPQFQSLFAESEAPLPWSTRAVLASGQFVSHYGWLLAFLVLAGASAGRAYLRSAKGRFRVDRWLLTSRLVFGIPLALDTGRLLRTLSLLMTNGVPLATALRIARGTLTNTILQAALTQATDRVKAGQSFTSAVASAGWFPAQAIQLSRVGEETGRLPEMLLEAADLLEAEGQENLERSMSLLVPGLTILMGLIVAGLIGSVFVGLLSINELAY